MNTIRRTNTAHRSLIRSILVIVALFLISFAGNGCGLWEGGAVSTDTGSVPGQGNPGGGNTGSLSVVSYIPVNGATGISRTPEIVIYFDRQLAPSTVNGSTVLITGPGGASVPGTTSYDYGTGIGGIFWSEVHFVPSGTLLPGTAFKVTLTTGIRAIDGGTLSYNFTWSFTTSGTPPQNGDAFRILSISPANGATGVSRILQLHANIDRELDSATVNSGTVTVTGPGGVPASTSVLYFYSPGVLNEILIGPKPAIWEANTTYTVTLTTEIRTVDGGTLTVPYTWSFTTRE